MTRLTFRPACSPVRRSQFEFSLAFVRERRAQDAAGRSAAEASEPGGPGALGGLGGPGGPESVGKVKQARDSVKEEIAEAKTVDELSAQSLKPGPGYAGADVADAREEDSVGEMLGTGVDFAFGEGMLARASRAEAAAAAAAATARARGRDPSNGLDGDGFEEIALSAEDPPQESGQQKTDATVSDDSRSAATGGGGAAKGASLGSHGVNVSEAARQGDGGDIECSICLTELSEGEVCRYLPQPCGHIFHLSCIDEWFHLSHSCPLCKRSIRDILQVSAAVAPSYCSLLLLLLLLKR